MPRTEINVGIFVAHAPATDVAPYEALVRRVVEDVRPPLEELAGVPWRFHLEESTRLSSDDPHRPSDFLDEASLRLVEGPYDLVFAVTDVPLASRRQRVVAGLASPIARVGVISTRRLRMTPRGRALNAVESEAVRWNAGVILLHLVGHLVRMRHARGEEYVTAPFAVDPERRSLPSFPPGAREAMERFARDVPEPDLTGGGAARAFGFHVRSALRHPREVLRAVLRSRALLLPLALPGLATAAVAPTFILIFTAEIWDVGLNMNDAVAWIFAPASILAATWFLLWVQNLFFPRKDRRVITEHMAVVNATIFLAMLLAMVGLFVLVGLLTLLIEFYVFPPDLIATWPTLNDPQVTTGDKVRLAAFVSTLGVLTGALAGGLESRNVIRHLALFEDEP